MLAKELLEILENKVDGDYPVLLRDKHGESYDIGGVEVLIARDGKVTLKVGEFIEED